MNVRRWVPPLVWAGVILVATSLPGSTIPTFLAPYDKVVHFTMYGVFAGLLAHGAVAGLGGWRVVVIASVIASAFGAADEWHQQFVPDRDADVADWQADTAGAVAGALGAAAYRRVRTLRSK